MRFARLRASSALKQRAVAIAAAAWLALLASVSHAQPATQPQELNLALASSTTVYGPIWIAIADKLFEKNGVKVNILNYNAQSTGAAMLAADQIDVFGTNAFAPLRVAQQGKPVSYLINVSNADARVWAFVAKPAIQTMAQLQAMGTDCRIANLPAGAGHAAYLKGVMRAYNLHCTTGVVGSPPLLATGVSSGQYDAAPTLPLDAYALVEQGRGRLLIDPAKLTPAEAKAIYPYEHPLVVFFGLQNRVQEKREAVVHFLRAIREADALLAKMTPEEAARTTSGIKEAFGGSSIASLTEQWRLALPTFPVGPDAGAITERDWKDLIAAAGPYWNLPEAEGAVWSKYGTMVDMSFFNAAR